MFSRVGSGNSVLVNMVDRTMYGKIIPGTYQPYRCAIKNGSSPGCKYSVILKYCFIVVEVRGN